MSVKVRLYRGGGWEVDIRLTLPTGEKVRERKRAPVTSKTSAIRWGVRREQEILLHGVAEDTGCVCEVPSVREFATRFLDEYVVANRHKPSGVATKERVLRLHILPLLGDRKLDEVSDVDVQRLKKRLERKSAKTVNNVLSVLNRMLHVAVEWQVVPSVSCRIRLGPVQVKEAPFHDFGAFDRLVESAERVSENALLAVLLGGQAGLRCGEILGLEWRDVRFNQGLLVVERAVWEGHVGSPKNGRSRVVPLAARLDGALRRFRRDRGPSVLCDEDGHRLTRRMVQHLVKRAAKEARVSPTGVHALRHTFCSHLAMRGAPTRAIQELAGHQDLKTTQRYMHLSPQAVRDAIRLLDVSEFGDIVETAADAG